MAFYFRLNDTAWSSCIHGVCSQLLWSELRCNESDDTLQSICDRNERKPEIGSFHNSNPLGTGATCYRFEKKPFLARKGQLVLSRDVLSAYTQSEWPLTDRPLCRSHVKKLVLPVVTVRIKVKLYRELIKMMLPMEKAGLLRRQDRCKTLAKPYRSSPTNIQWHYV